MRKISILGCLALAGCLTTEPPSAADFALRDRAVRPDSAAEAEGAAADAVRAVLIDPQSAQFEFQEPVRSAYANGQRRFGWFLCGTVNSKNRFGGYIGRIPFIAYFDPDDPSEAELLRMSDYDTPFYVQGDCEDVYDAATERLSPTD